MRINSREKIFAQYSVSPDPSITHRALILGCIAKGKTYVINPCLNNESRAAISCIKKLGAKVKIKNGVVEIKPPKMLSSGGRIDCECSETVMRFLCGIAAGSGMRLELTGDRRLCQHSMRNVKEPLEAMGATVALKNYSVPPILVEGETVRPIDYFLPIGSSQVKSSILLCALTGKVRAIVKEGTRSRNHMEILLKEMGADITVDEKNNSVDMKESEIKGKKLYVCGDFTEAVYYLAQGLLSGRTECKNVGVNPTRTRVLQLFRRMGAKIKITNRRMLCGEPIADIVAEKSDLKAILVTDEEAYSVFDELPALAVVMGMARGESVIAEHKAIKDLDADLFDEISGAIRSVGGNCRRFSSPDAAGIAIKGVERYRGGNVKCGYSASVGMAAAVALTVSEEGGEIEDEYVIDAQYPQFSETLGLNSFAYVCKRVHSSDISEAHAFLFGKSGLSNYSFGVKEIRATKKISSEIKEFDGFEVCPEFAGEAAKKTLKYKGVAKTTKSPDAVKGSAGIATDGFALSAALKRAQIATDGAKVLLLGSGIAAKNIAETLIGEKASVSVYDPEKSGVDLKKKMNEQAFALGELSKDVKYDLIVNTTAFGAGGKTGISPIDDEIIANAGNVADFSRTEGGTELEKLAASHGIKTINGEELAFYKTYVAVSLFSSAEPDINAAAGLYDEYKRDEYKRAEKPSE